MNRKSINLSDINSACKLRAEENKSEQTAEVNWTDRKGSRIADTLT